MDKFNKNDPSRCPQCGGVADFSYHRPVIEGRARICIVTREEHMHRHCGTCRYQWAESPAA
jgi:hypothetical protein